MRESNPVGSEELVAAYAAADDWLREHPPVLEWFGGQFAPAEVPSDAPICEALERAHELVRSDPAHAVVRLGAVEPMGAASTTPVSATTGPAADATPAARRHRVNRGETLGRIAQRYGCDLGVLARANELRAPSYAIRPGQELTLAGCSG